MFLMYSRRAHTTHIRIERLQVQVVYFHPGGNVANAGLTRPMVHELDENGRGLRGTLEDGIVEHLATGQNQSRY
jgi:hypothetical protein